MCTAKKFQRSDVQLSERLCAFLGIMPGRRRWHLLEHHSTMVLRGLKEGVQLGPMMPGDVIWLDSRCFFSSLFGLLSLSGRFVLLRQQMIKTKVLLRQQIKNKFY